MKLESKKELFMFYFYSNCDLILKDFELTKQECLALIHTYILTEKNSNVSLKEIRERMEMSKPAISILMSKLEKKGYLERHLNKQNLREIYVSLSEYSMVIAEKTIQKIDLYISKIIDKMGLDKVENLIELNKLFKETSKEVMEEEKTC